MKCSQCGSTQFKNGRCAYCGTECAETEAATRAQNTYPTVRPRAEHGVEVFEATVNGILEITCKFRDCAACGSGFLINEDGYALTNTHVVTHESKPCTDISVKIVGETVSAKIILLGDDKGGSGSGVDLALLKLSKIPRTAKPIKLWDSDKIKVGEQVFVIGNSLGDGTCMTSGIISDRQRLLNGKPMIMTDCAINGGNSGGPIFNRTGYAIGVIVASRLNRDGSSTEGMNYAIPINIAKEFLQGKHTAVKLTGGAFTLPPPPPPTRTKANAPCPSCHSDNTWIENGLFVCDNCGFVQGDKY